LEGNIVRGGGSANCFSKRILVKARLDSGKVRNVLDKRDQNLVNINQILVINSQILVDNSQILVINSQVLVDNNQILVINSQVLVDNSQILVDDVQILDNVTLKAIRRCRRWRFQNGVRSKFESDETRQGVADRFCHFQIQT